MNPIGLLPADPRLPHLAQAMDGQAMAMEWRYDRAELNAGCPAG